MVTLYSRLPDRIEVDGRKYRLKPSFDRVLETFDVFTRDWPDADKIDYACWLLIRGRPRNKVTALNAAYDALIEPKKADGPKTFDFVQDAPLIYAAFMQAYGIDLFQQRIHWWRFINLLNALPSDTRFVEVVSIRAKPLPKPTKHNQNEIENLLRAKAKYGLAISQEDREKQFQAGLAKIAQAFTR